MRASCSRWQRSKQQVFKEKMLHVSYKRAYITPTDHMTYTANIYDIGLQLFSDMVHISGLTAKVIQRVPYIIPDFSGSLLAKSPKSNPPNFVLLGLQVENGELLKFFDPLGPEKIFVQWDLSLHKINSKNLSEIQKIPKSPQKTIKPLHT